MSEQKILCVQISGATAWNAEGIKFSDIKIDDKWKVVNIIPSPVINPQLKESDTVAVAFFILEK